MLRRLFLCLIGCLTFHSATPLFSQDVPQPLSIGIVPSLMNDLPIGQQKFITGEFPVLVKTFTGISGLLHHGKSANEVAQRLVAGTDHFAVFQGIEFARLQKSNPEMQPLVLSVYRSPKQHAVVVVKKDAAISSFADLKGKDVILLKQGKEHCRLFAEKSAGGDPAKYFGKILTPENAEAALDDLLRNKAPAAIVDQASLDIYQEVNPGRFNRLKVIVKSEAFPPSVIAYHPKKVGANVVNQFRNGMLKANASDSSREVMSTFKITAFEPVPANFEAWLADIRKAYPE